MSRGLTLWLTALAMVAFAGNSLLCRAALDTTAIDPASFTGIRLLAGALTLWLVVRWQARAPVLSGSWPSALALFAYAILFSFAYLGLSAGTGALLLFGAVQATMILYGLWRGERLAAWQWLGLGLALAGMAGLFLPGFTAPPPGAGLMMVAAGVAWGVYSLRGRGGGDPTAVTAGNFLRTLPLAAGVSLLALPWASLDPAGVLYAVASGALASGLGYAVWYMALPGLSPTSAATVQLSAPVIAALGGVALLAEPFSLRLLLASVAILGGIALVIRRPVAART